MDSNTDDAKGRVKEAVGDLTDNDRLKREGQHDRTVGKAKELIDDVGEKAKDLVDDLKDKVHHADKR
ncbi:MAG: CsbD family protein [Acidimicrobiia bacterium]